LVVAILAGCGGSGATEAQSAWQSVTAQGVRFQAPAGWKVEHARGRVTASRGSELVQISAFPLVKPYDDSLFTRVAGELRSRMEDLARQTGGEVTADKTVTAGGIRSHAYEVTLGDHVDEYTFVLEDRKEHLLLCRRKAGGSSSFCGQLVKSFSA
jgi:hypothetical protein